MKRNLPKINFHLLNSIDEPTYLERHCNSKIKREKLHRCSFLRKDLGTIMVSTITFSVFLRIPVRHWETNLCVINHWKNSNFNIICYILMKWHWSITVFFFFMLICIVFINKIENNFSVYPDILFFTT